MKTSDLHTKSKAELEKQAQDLKGKLAQLRFAASLGKLKDVREIREAKKTIAQILTVLGQVKK